MATARNQVLNPIDITISPTGTVSSAQANMQLSDNAEIQFDSSATFPLNLVFTSLFGSVSVPAGGSNNTPLAASAVTVNYVIKRQDNGVQTGGPYSVQWGIGALQINITSLTPTPDPIAVSVLGSIQFTADIDYKIVWKNQNGTVVTVWSPQPGEIYQVPPNPVQQARPGASGLVNYYLTAADNVQGKGTVHIGS
jgi:hypothetical protein